MADKGEEKMANKEVLSFAIVGFLALALVSYGMMIYGFSWKALACFAVLAVTHLSTLYMLYKFYKGQNVP